MAAATAITGAGVVGAVPAGAVSDGDPVTDPAFAFAAKVAMGDASACSGALVAAQWVITAKSCADAGTPRTTAGAPAQLTTVTVGRLDLTGTAGHVRRVAWVVPHPDRDVALLRLVVPAVGVTPVALGSTPPAPGETFQALGFGRTATQWVPDKLHGVAVTAAAVTATTVDITSSGGPTTCKGDAGGPTVRLVDGRPELVALHHTSWQGGCLGETETRRDAIETRTDDLVAWIRQHSVSACNAGGGTAGPGDQGSIARLADFTGDCRTDVVSQRADGTLRFYPSSGQLSGTTPLFPGPYRNVNGTTSWTTTNRPHVLVGDFNGDGRADLIGGTSDGRLTAQASTGDLSADNKLFGPEVVVGTGFRASSLPRLFVGDFNGDGRTDLLGQLANGTLRVWPSSGDLSADARLFSIAPSDVGTGFTTAEVPRILTGDFNGDGRTDLIAQFADGSLKAYPSSGDVSVSGRLFPTTGSAKVVGSGWRTSSIPRILPADVDGDGITDLVAQLADGQLRAYVSTGDLTGSAVTFPGPYRYVGTDSNWASANRPRLMVGDLSGDARTDLVAQHTDGTLLAFESTGDLSADNKLFVKSQNTVGTGWTSTSIPRFF
ncbi:fusidic acid esterase FusH [Micromonospora endophytica]|nr:fusidic acid esterase FusH [Micromonospora endophytica]